MIKSAFINGLSITDTVLTATLDEKGSPDCRYVCQCGLKFHELNIRVVRLAESERIRKILAETEKIPYEPKHRLVCLTCRSEERSRVLSKKVTRTPKQQANLKMGSKRKTEPATQKGLDAVKMLLAGCSMGVISKRLKVSTSSVLIWRLRWIQVPKLEAENAQLAERVQELVRQLAEA